MKTLTLSFALLALGATNAHASATYILTLTNGSQMPLSPGAVYAKDGGSAEQRVGEMPSRGFVQLCQTGNNMERANELRMSREVKAVALTGGMIMPGESRSVEITVADPSKQSIHFETMYGKTKDACAVGTINSHTLYALKEHVSSEYAGKDEVLVTGAFTDPALNLGHEAYSCPGAMSAIECVRALSMPNGGKQAIRFFAGYLPSLVSFLEQKFGGADTLSLLFPASGAVQFTVKLKH